MLKVGVFHLSRCFCPPTCTNTQYVATHSLASFPNKASRVMQQIRQEPSFQNYDERDLSLLHVYFKVELQTNLREYVKSRRRALLRPSLA